MRDAVAAPSMLVSLCQQLTRALGPGIGVACTDVNGDPGRLWPAERDAVRNAIPRRQREFTAGRGAARAAMAQVGLAPAAIPSAADRSPIWPQGVVGSIAHTAAVCVAIAGRRGRAFALGIDIEDDQPLDTALWHLICTRQELAVLACLPPAEQGRHACRLFCAKEAFYKWQYPQTGRMLEFGDVQVTLSQDQQRFHARLCAPAPCRSTPAPPIAREGRLLAAHGLVIAWLCGEADRH